MKLSNQLNEALNIQILKEMHNALVYMQIASFFEDLQLKNLAKYFKNQSNDEKSHADKFMQHINDRSGGKVDLGDVDGPNLQLGSVEDVATNYVSVEEDTTESIEALYDLAFMEKSYMDLGFLEEMLNEQVSEEDEANEFAGKAKLVKDLVLFDSTFGD